MPSSSGNPVFHFQCGHADELCHVVRDQCQAFTAGMAGDMDVVHANGLSKLFQRSANGAVVLGGLDAVGPVTGSGSLS